MIVRIRTQSLTLAEQKELRRFLEQPHEPRSCHPALGGERTPLLRSLAQKGYLRLDREENGFEYYRLLTDR